MNNRYNMLSMVFPYIIGALIGAGIALLMAPQSGQETRSLILNKGMEIKDRAVESVEDTRDRASRAIGDITEQTKESLSSIRDRSGEVIDDQKSRVEEGLKSAKRSVRG